MPQRHLAAALAAQRHGLPRLRSQARDLLSVSGQPSLPRGLAAVMPESGEQITNLQHSPDITRCSVQHCMLMTKVRGEWNG